MKKLLSAFITLVVLLTALSGVTVSADTSVSVNDGFYLKAVPEASSDFVLVYDLCCNDSTGLGVATVGLTLDYSENLQLEGCEQVYGGGMFISSQYIDEKPYLMLWAGGTVTLPEGETVIARLVFNVVKTLGRGIYLDLGYDPDNSPSDLDGDYHDESDLPSAGMTEYTYKELREEFPSLPKIPYAPPVNINENGFYLKPVPEASTKETLVYDLCLKDVNECAVSSFGVMLEYSDELDLVSCDFTYGKGSFITSENIDDKPFLILWVAGTFSLGFEETAIARITFDIVGDIEAGCNLGIEYDSENYPADINGNYINTQNMPIMGVLEFSFGDIARQFPFFAKTPGDVNDDGKVNLTDVAAVLKYIAKWDVELNLDAANVNGDGKVNLGDVSLMLKKIAKWDVELT